MPPKVRGRQQGHCKEGGRPTAGKRKKWLVFFVGIRKYSQKISLFEAYSRARRGGPSGGAWQQIQPTCPWPCAFLVSTFDDVRLSGLPQCGQELIVRQEVSWLETQCATALQCDWIVARWELGARE